jgi:hypothetical protein
VVRQGSGEQCWRGRYPIMEEGVMPPPRKEVSIGDEGVVRKKPHQEEETIGEEGVTWYP